MKQAEPIGIGIFGSIYGFGAGIALGCAYGPAKALEQGIVSKNSNIIYKIIILLLAAFLGSMVGGVLGIIYGPYISSKLTKKKKGGDEINPNMIDRI